MTLNCKLVVQTHLLSNKFLLLDMQKLAIHFRHKIDYYSELISIRYLISSDEIQI